MKKQTIILSAVFLLLLSSALLPTFALGNRPETRNFRAHLSGRLWISRVNPNATYMINTRAQGQAIFQVNPQQTEIRFLLIAANIQNITMAHIHLDNGDPLGPIVVWLYPREPPAQLIPRRFNGILAYGKINATNLTGPLEGMTIKDLVAKMHEGMAYAVIHTSQHPPGEIRGWIH